MLLGPVNATLTVRTGRGGAAAKAGHDLLIEVTRWSATLDEGVIELEADPRSLRVLEGTGGMSALDDDDKASIARRIDKDVLEGAPIVFRSTRVERAGSRLDVEGELELAGRRRSIAFTLEVAGDGRVAGSARLKQSDWGIKPFSALFGTLKVADVVEVRMDARSDDIG